MGSANSVCWQAHRGGGAHDAPDNTLAADLYAWKLGGIPEADIRTTRDGAIICLHDETPARTTDAPEAVSDRPICTFTYDEIREWDAGARFHETFRGQRIPLLAEVFSEMRGRPERNLYLDLKEVDLQKLADMIDAYQVNRQIIFAHHDQANCRRMKEMASGVRTMLWIGGSAERIRQMYLTVHDHGYEGLDQIQLHLKPTNDISGWEYDLDADFLQSALRNANEHGVDFEVFPFHFRPESMNALLDMGIRWFATDEPARFLQCVHAWSASQKHDRISRSSHDL